MLDPVYLLWVQLGNIPAHLESPMSACFIIRVSYLLDKAAFRDKKERASGT